MQNASWIYTTCTPVDLFIFFSVQPECGVWLARLECRRQCADSEMLGRWLCINSPSAILSCDYIPRAVSSLTLLRPKLQASYHKESVSHGTNLTITIFYHGVIQGREETSNWVSASSQGLPISYLWSLELFTINFARVQLVVTAKTLTANGSHEKQTNKLN